MRVLNVAEKPSMARQLSFFLAGGDVDSVDTLAMPIFTLDLLPRRRMEGTSIVAILRSLKSSEEAM